MFMWRRAGCVCVCVYMNTCLCVTSGWWVARVWVCACAHSTNNPANVTFHIKKIFLRKKLRSTKNSVPQPEEKLTTMRGLRRPRRPLDDGQRSFTGGHHSFMANEDMCVMMWRSHQVKKGANEDGRGEEKLTTMRGLETAKETTRRWSALIHRWPSFINGK